MIELLPTFAVFLLVLCSFLVYSLYPDESSSVEHSLIPTTGWGHEGCRLGSGDLNKAVQVRQ